MRIVIDLQACQSESRFRGIGRYSMSLALAITRNAGIHEIWLVLNSALPEAIPAIRAAFDSLVPSEHIRVFDIPGPVAEMDPNNAWRAMAAQKIREQFIFSLKPDIVHVSTLIEGWLDDLVSSVSAFEVPIPTSVTLYDLIPYIYPKAYLPNQSVKDYYFKKIQFLKNSDLFLAISKYTLDEAISVLGINPDSIFNISAAADNSFKPAILTPNEKIELLNRYQINKQFILCAPGGFDDRKNINNLLKAFTFLPEPLRKDYQLVIGSKIPDGTIRNQITSEARKNGFSEGSLILTGYIPDNDLVKLYSTCKFSIFPSWYEGFGLPALEAMSCGAPTIGSDRTSIPEVIGRADAMFDPYKPESIANKITEVITNDDFRQNLKTHGLIQASNFSWDKSAKRAMEAFETLHEKVAHRKKTSIPANVNERLRLAYFSPVPPEKSGISDYSAELLPELAKYYEIELISDQSELTDQWIIDNIPVKSVAWFKGHRYYYDRLLYQFGNSPFHKHMFDLLARYPGVVVLHDFYMSSVLNFLEVRNQNPGIFTKELYHSHGYSALRKFYTDGREAAVIEYPVNLRVFEGAAGVIAHSQFSQDLVKRWYGNICKIEWARIPFLRNIKVYLPKDEARKRLDINADDFVICSFGFIDSTKLNDRVIQSWFRSNLADNSKCFLVFVGQNHGGEYGKNLLEKIKSSTACGRIIITGYLPITGYSEWLSAADAAIQLRGISKGETSAAIFDCLAHGLPLIFNANGSASEIPDTVGVKLPDIFTDDQLKEAIESVHSNQQLRKQLSESAIDYIRIQHSPALIGTIYRDSIEQFAIEHPLSYQHQLIKSIANIENKIQPSKNDMVEVAKSIAINQQIFRLNQLFLDITVLVKTDLQTGIERVTRSILNEFLHTPPEGYRIEPIYWKDGAFYYARKFTLLFLNIDEDLLSDSPIETNDGDYYLSLEWNPGAVLESRDNLKAFVNKGVKVNFIVFDILPILHTEWFPEFASVSKDWLKVITEVSSGIICISKATADEVLEWTLLNSQLRLTPLNLGHFHLGADIKNSMPSTGVPANASKVLMSVKNIPSFLMVGTIEPRKGHLQAIKAFDVLWSNGINVKLVIVGREGWKSLSDNQRRTIPQIVSTLKSHNELNKRLIWLEDTSDEYLEKVYDASICLLAPSEGEGFGLPLIEAAMHMKPIIARDIPVFREVAGENALYFDGLDANDLATAIKDWLNLNKSGKAPASEKIPFLTWAQSAEQLKDVIFGNNWKCP